MITESMAANLVHAAFDALPGFVDAIMDIRIKNSCFRYHKWRVLIELVNADRIAQGKRPRWQPIRRIKMRRANAMCTASKLTCSTIEKAVDRRLAEEKDRIAKSYTTGVATV